MKRVKKNILPVLLLAAAVGGLCAQAPKQPKLESVPPAQEQQDQPQVRIITTVRTVATPVVVIDSSGEFVTNLEKPDFTLTDNGKRQQINQFEQTWSPLSIAIVVDTSTRIEPLLPEIRKSGILFTQLVLGESGEAMVITFDHRVEITQEFTNNGDLIEKALKEVKAGGSQSRLTDGILRAIGRLKMRPQERRKVIVAIAEGRDMGSETPLGQALREAQLSGISVYTVELSTFKALVKKEAPPTVWDPFPPGARPTRPGITPAPRGVDEVQLFPLIVEAVRGAKAMIFDKPLKVYAAGTGADHINVYREKGIEDAVQKIGKELHSQYLITYNPDNLRASEFHAIDVKVARLGVKVRARPGYFYVPTSENTAIPTPDGGKKP
jgi:VWFA-related protein